MLGTTGLVVTVENVNNTNVQSWQIDLLYSDPSSGVTPATPFAFSDNGSTPTATFTPDVRRSYRWQLKVWSTPNRPGTPDDTDIRVFSVPEANTLVIPPAQIWPKPLPDPRSGDPGNKLNEMNFGGQPDGWAGNADNDGLLNDTLTKLLSTNPRIRYVDNGTGVAFAKQNGSRDLPYQTIQQALDDISGTGSGWVVSIAPGSYEESLTVPSQNSIALIGADYAVTKINISSSNPITWSVDGFSYLALRNMQVHSVNAVDAGSTPPDVGILYLENASLVSMTSGVHPVDIIGVGPNTFIDDVQTDGRLAVDGIDHLTVVSCGSFSAYDALFSGGSMTISGDALFTDCQIDPGTSLIFTGYVQSLFVDGMTNYWLNASSVSIIGSPTFVLMDSGGSGTVLPFEATYWVDPSRSTSSQDGSVANPFITAQAAYDHGVTIPSKKFTVFLTSGDYSTQDLTVSGPEAGGPVSCVFIGLGGSRVHSNGEPLVTFNNIGIFNGSESGNFWTELHNISCLGLTTVADMLWKGVYAASFNITSSTVFISADDLKAFLANGTGTAPLGQFVITDGDVYGPGAAVTDNGIVVWDGVGGTKAKDSGIDVGAIATAQSTADNALARGMFALTGAANNSDTTHVGKVGTVSHTVTTTYTVRKNATQALPAKSEITLIAIGAGQLVIAPEDGTVIIRTAETLKARKQYSWVTLKKDATTQDLWWLTGDLELAP